MPPLLRRAWAKVNLALQVGPPEPPHSGRPGWHPICSWTHAIDLADTLTVERAARSDYRIEWAPDAPQPSPIDWPPERDLAVRAHGLLEAEAGRELPLRLRLSKRIPVGGGLGGGSSDAAAALLAVDALFDLRLGTGRLRTLGATLGSDVAFFIDAAADEPPRPAIVSGFGERVERLPDRRSGPLILFLPGFGCPTPLVYSAFDASPGGRAPGDVRAIAARGGPLEGLFNDLTPAAGAAVPGLLLARTLISAAMDREVHMTGSGSTLFIPARSVADARSLLGLASALPGIRAVAARLV